MDKIYPNAAVDLECGIPVIEDEDSITTPLLQNVKNLQAKSLLLSIFRGAFADEPSSSTGLTEHLLSASLENDKSVTTANGDKKAGKERRKKTNHKKAAAKPPRPPKAPLLDAADEKLIREIKEIARLKRARIERLRALKKMKGVVRQSSSSSSSSSNVIATLLTVIFCIVILHQGISSRSTTQSSSQGSPVTFHAAEARLVSIQFSGNPSASHPNTLTPGSPNLVEQVAGSDPPTKYI